MRYDVTAGPDVFHLNRSLSHYRAVDAQDNTTGSSVRAVHSALLSHHTIVTPPTVVPRKAKLVCFYTDTEAGALCSGAKSGWNCMFLAMIAQAMRAILFASATATSLKDFFANRVRAQSASGD